MVTVEQGIGYQSARVDDLVTLDSDRFTITVLEVVNGPVFPLQLVGIQAVHVSSVVLVEICKFVVEQDRRFQIRRHVKLDDTLGLRPHTRGRVLNECVLGRVVLRFGICCTELIAVLGDVDQIQGGGLRGLDSITVCVLESHFRDLKIDRR